MRRLPTLSMVAAGMSLAVFFACRAAVFAGTLPDISGTWYGNGHASRRCQISQSGTAVSLTNEQGATATATFTDPSTLRTSWSIFGGANITGRISGNLQTITWSNGTYWTRTPETAPPARPTPVPTPTPKPYWYLNWTNTEGATAPIDIIQTWTAVMRDGSAAYTCVSFKNTGSVAATRIHFELYLLDHGKHVADTSNLDRKGTFSPNVGIHGYSSLGDWGQGNRGYRDNCIGWRPDNGDERIDYSRLRYFSVKVKHIEYADGTSWPAE